MTTTQTPIHVSETFFSKAARYFSGFDSAVQEIVQNAYRAHLPLEGRRAMLDVYTEPDSLTFCDTGCGIHDIGQALSIAASSWGQGVEEEQDPAGMGLCAALSSAERVIVRSHFGSLEIEGDSFFGSAQYRAELLEHITNHRPDRNYATELVLIRPKLGNQRDIITILEKACEWYASMDTRLLDADQKVLKIRSALERSSPLMDEYGKQRRAGDCLIYESDNRYSGWMTGLSVVWHGQRIRVNTDRPELLRTMTFEHLGEVQGVRPHNAGKGLLIVVDQGSPVTPKLPDRQELVYDQKTADFIWQAMEGVVRHRVSDMLAYVGEIVEGLNFNGYNDYDIDRLINAPREYTSELCSKLRQVVMQTRAGHLARAALPGGGVCPVDVKELPDLLVPKLLLHTADDLYIPTDVELDRNDGTCFNFADADAADVRLSGELEETPFGTLPEGLAIDLRPVVGERSSLCDSYNSAVVVAHVPMEYSELVGNYGHIQQRMISTGGQPLKVTIHSFAHDTFENEDCEDHLEDGLSLSMRSEPDDKDQQSIRQLLSQAQTVREAEVTGLSVSDTEKSMDLDDRLFIGHPKALCELLEAVYDQAQAYELDYDEEQEALRQLRDEIDSAQHELTGVVALRGPLNALLAKLGDRVYIRSVKSIQIDVEDQKITLVHTTDGPEKTEVFGIEL